MDIGICPGKEAISIGVMHIYNYERNRILQMFILSRAYYLAHTVNLLK